MRVLLTGANGYVGSYISEALLAGDHDVRLAVHDHDRVADYDTRFNDVMEGDITDSAFCTRAMREVDAVIHLAAEVGNYDEKKNYRVNYDGTVNLIEAARAAAVGRFVFVSSVSAKRKVRGPYGRSKRMAEDAVRQSGLEYTIFRPTTIMGKESPGLNRIITNVNRFPFFIPMVKTGRYLRHPVYVHDFVDVVVRSLALPACRNRLYEIGGEQPIEFRELVRKINEKWGNRPKILIPVPVTVFRAAAYVFERVFDVPPFTREHVNSLTEDTVMDTMPAKRDLSFSPRATDEMLTDVIAEIKAGVSCP